MKLAALFSLLSDNECAAYKREGDGQQRPSAPPSEWIVAVARHSIAFNRDRCGHEVVKLYDVELYELRADAWDRQMALMKIDMSANDWARIALPKWVVAQ